MTRAAAKKTKIVKASRPAQQRRSQEKRDLFIQAGETIFAMHGYEKTRIADLAEAVGVSVGIFYQRFDNKRGFYDALSADLEEQLTLEHKKFFDAVGDRISPFTFFQKFVHHLATIIEDHIGFFRSMIYLAHHDKQVVTRINEGDAYAQTLLEDYILKRKWTSKSKLREMQIYQAYMMTTKTLLVTALNQTAPKGLEPRSDKMAKELAHMLMGYLRIDKS